MKFKFILITLIFTICNAVYAQVKFPNVLQQKINKGEIKGNYIPHDEFLKMFPDFFKNATYQFDYETMVNGFDKVEFEGSATFNNVLFPCTTAETNNLLTGLGILNVQFTPNLIHNAKLYLDKDNYISTPTYLKYPAYTKLTKEAETSYQAFNLFYKNTITSYFSLKKADQVNVLSAGTLEIPIEQVSKGLTLQFEYDRSNIWVSGKTRSNFPSHALYTLIVKTADGVEVKRYGQAIFFEGSHSNYHYDVVRRTLIDVTFPIAVENLTNRFLNDYEFFKVIVDKQNQSDKQMPANVKAFKARLNSIISEKEDIEQNLLSIGIKYDFNSSMNVDAVGSGIKYTGP
jgi:hypothetical protein